LVRGKSARVIGNLQTLLTLVKGLPLTYNRDLQEDKPPVFDALDQTIISLIVVEGVVSGMKMDTAKCAEAVSDPSLLATDIVDYLVEKGVPFRNAHHVIGALVAMAEEKSVPLNKLTLHDVQLVDAHFAADWVECFDVENALKAREKTGMPGPQEVTKQIARMKSLF